jgi:hypothetical protein
MCLTIAVSAAAYVQRQWWKAHRQEFSVKQFDALTSFRLFGKLSVVYGIQLLTAIALI